MLPLRLATALVLGLGLSACSGADTATRNAPLQTPMINPAAASLAVQEVRVNVPDTLKVSEANRYYPGGDIVWREDPPGDRHAQVKAIFEGALKAGVAQMPEGNVPAVLDITVTRFHALSEKARYTIGGVHAVQFEYALRNPETGALYAEPRFVKADFKALGGQEAIEAERNGITQKRRISEHLAKVIQEELRSAAGHRAEALGLVGAINQI